MEILAIIPARGGSKGLPGKNIRMMHGHPLIAYSILAAQQCRQITRVVVNTDHAEIADIARRYGAEVPFLRPAEFAQDTSTDLEVFRHALEWHKANEHYRPELIVQLRPTSPLRKAGWIDHAIDSLVNSTADSLRVVTPSPITPYKMWRIQDLHAPMEPLLTVEGMDEPFNMPRQALPQTFWQIGTLDVIRTAVIENGSMSGKHILPFIVDHAYAADIDDLESFRNTEIKMQQLDCLRFDG